MNTLPVIQSLTMISREIAEVTGKRHDNVLRDIGVILGRWSVPCCIPTLKRGNDKY